MQRYLDVHHLHPGAGVRKRGKELAGTLRAEAGFIEVGMGRSPIDSNTSR